MAGSVGQGQHRGLEGVERCAGFRCAGIYGSGARDSGARDSGSTDSGWGDADWEKFRGTNDFPRRVSSGRVFLLRCWTGMTRRCLRVKTPKVRGSYIMTFCCLRVGFLRARCGFPDTSSASSVSGGRSDADTGDTAEVASEKEALVRKTRASLSRQTRQSLSDPPVRDVSDLGGVQVRAKQRLVPTDTHTVLAGSVDASKITLRITGLTGGRLQKLSSDARPVWEDIGPSGTPSNQYREFTLADLQAGKIGLLAGTADIAFQIQAADDGPHLSDSDPKSGDEDPAAAEIQVVAVAKTSAGYRDSINADGVLTPDLDTLEAWKESARVHVGTLHIVAKLMGKQVGDKLSLGTGYDENEITFQWDGATGELSLEIAGNATTNEIRTALEFLEFESVFSSSASTRKVLVFPTLSGLGNFAHRTDETAGLVRYYFFDSRPVVCRRKRSGCRTHSFRKEWVFGRSHV